MPSTPHLVFGVIYSSLGNNVSNTHVTFTTSLGTVSANSNSTGQYLVDLANAGYTAGETVSYLAFDEFRNETYSGSFEVAGGGNEIDIRLSAITVANTVGGNRDVQVYSIGAKPISSLNPFPVIDTNLPDNYDTTWDITRSDRQPNSETITLGSVSYKRSFTYSNNVMTARTRWIRQ